MNTQKRLNLIFQSDENSYKISSLTKNNTHLQRRKQQRAINETMINIALLYGKKQFSYGDILFTLNDKSLCNTPYNKFIDALRGLRVVCKQGFPNPQIITVYWHKDTKRKMNK